MADSGGMANTSKVHLHCILFGIYQFIYHFFCQQLVQPPVLGPQCASDMSAAHLFESCEILRV